MTRSAGIVGSADAGYFTSVLDLIDHSALNMVTKDLNGKPFQLTFVRSSQMMIFAKVICDPPLGQSTIVPHNQDAVCLQHRIGISSRYCGC